MKYAMTPAEYDAAKRELMRRCPYLSHTSGKRSAERNAAVGGNPASKHLLGMGDDFVSEDGDYDEASEVAEELGLWFIAHDKGSGNHLHTQGLSPGLVPTWWSEKYLDSSAPASTPQPPPPPES